MSQSAGTSRISLIRCEREHLLERVGMTFDELPALLDTLIDGHYPIVEALGAYLRDSFDHAAQISDVLDTFREIAISLDEAYLSSVSHLANEIIWVLTILSGSFIPLTFIAGVYGINFEHMPELHWQYGYQLTWLVMLSVVAALRFYFRRNGWIGSKRERSD